jgi:hypothetical protein
MPGGYPGSYPRPQAGHFYKGKNPGAQGEPYPPTHCRELVHVPRELPRKLPVVHGVGPEMARWWTASYDQRGMRAWLGRKILDWGRVADLGSPVNPGRARELSSLKGDKTTDQDQDPTAVVKTYMYS